MDIDTVLPLASIPQLWIASPETWMARQRDADFLILERDYVSKERIKPLVEAAQRAWSKGKIEYDRALLETFQLEAADSDECWAEFEALHEALAGLVKP